MKKLKPRFKARIRKNKQIIMNSELAMEGKFMVLNIKVKFMQLCVSLLQIKFQNL